MTISERLTAQVNNHVPDLAKQLKPALDLANQQLEWQCGVMMGVSLAKGMIANVVANVKLGTWLIVLANPRKLFTIHFNVPPEAPFTRREFVDNACAASTEMFGRVPTGQEVLLAIDDIVERHGGEPGGETLQLDQAHLRRIFGLLFAPILNRDEVVNDADQLIAKNICPLHVGLIGKGSEPNTICGLWPVGLSLGVYIEHVDRSVHDHVSHT